MKYIKIMGLIAACLFAVFAGQACAQHSSSHTKVGVYVRGEENLNDIIENYINNGLTNLENITVTYTQLDCAIDIVVKKLKGDNSNAGNGCAISVSIIDRFDSLPITRAIEELSTLIPKIKGQPEITKQLESLSKEFVRIAISTTKIKSFQNSFLYTGNAGQLRELCSRIIKDFDNEYLKKKRKVIQRKYY